MRAAAALLLAAPAAAYNGYALSRTGGASFAGTRASVFDATSTEFDKLANGVTLCMWVRLNDLTASRTMLPISINQASGCTGCGSSLSR